MTSQRPSAYTDSGVELLRQRLAEADVWCRDYSSLTIAAEAFRFYCNQSSTPSDVFFMKQDGRNFWRTLALPVPLQDWNDHINEKSPDSLPVIIWPLLARRQEIMKLQGFISNQSQYGVMQEGRLLITDSSESLFDSASKAETFGFFDLWDIPPWDTWVWFEPDVEDHFGGGTLLSWITPPLFDLVQNGIDVNASGCIQWADELDTPFTRELRLVHLL